MTPGDLAIAILGAVIVPASVGYSRWLAAAGRFPSPEFLFFLWFVLARTKMAMDDKFYYQQRDSQWYDWLCLLLTWAFWLVAAPSVPDMHSIQIGFLLPAALVIAVFWIAVANWPIREARFIFWCIHNILAALVIVAIHYDYVQMSWIMPLFLILLLLVDFILSIREWRLGQ